MIYAWNNVPRAERTDEFSDQIHQLIQNDPNASISDVISCLKWFAPTDRDTVMEIYNRITSFGRYYDWWDLLESIPQENRIAYLRRIADQLSSDFPQGRTAANANAIDQRGRILFETPFDQPFPPLQQIARGQNIDVVGQEALTQQHETIAEAYRNLIADPRVASSISAVTNLSPEALNEAFDNMTKVLRGWIKFRVRIRKGIQDKDLFKFNTAERALDLMQGAANIEHHRASTPESYRTFSYRNIPNIIMPNIIQLYVVLFNAINRAQIISFEDFVKTWLSENPTRVNRSFETIGDYIKTHNEAIQLAALCLNKANTKDIPQFVENNLKENLNIDRVLTSALYSKVNYMPLIEALFMIMRGHNNNLESADESNRPACAEGAYLNILRELTRFLGETDTLAMIDGVKVVSCANA